MKFFKIFLAAFFDQDAFANSSMALQPEESFGGLNIRNGSLTSKRGCEIVT